MSRHVVTAAYRTSARPIRHASAKMTVCGKRASVGYGCGYGAADQQPVSRRRERLRVDLLAVLLDHLADLPEQGDLRHYFFFFFLVHRPHPIFPLFPTAPFFE